MSMIKICGITNLEDALYAEKCGADFLGFIFTQHSKRKVSPQHVKEIVAHLSAAKPIGVFIEQSHEETLEIAQDCNLFGVQHHSYFAQGFDNFFYIYAHGFSAQKPIDNIINQPGPNKFLIDHTTKTQYGGTGQSFDWSALPAAHMDDIIIAGGIGPDNVREALSYSPFAIDLSSRVEIAPGQKDHRLLDQLFQEIQK